MTSKAPDVPLDKVEWRIQGSPANGSVSVVAYLDAPTVADLLDDWVGPFGWKDAYEPVGNGDKALWCLLSIKHEDEWVTKVDLGVPSNMEAAKGLVSDAFKRVAMRKWGVGRNVFDLPVLRIKKFRQYQKGGKDMAALTGESAVEIKERLKALGFEDAAKQTRVAADEPEAQEDPQHGAQTPHPVQTIRERVKAANLTDAFIVFLADRFNASRLDELDDEQLAKVLTATGSKEGLATIAEYGEAAA